MFDFIGERGEGSDADDEADEEPDDREDDAYDAADLARLGLSVLSQVPGIFTGITISPSLLLRQCPNRYAFRAGRNLPDKEFRYLRTVIVTEHLLYYIIMEAIILEERCIWFKVDISTILVRRLLCFVALEVTFLKR